MRSDPSLRQYPRSSPAGPAPVRLARGVAGDPCCLDFDQLRMRLSLRVRHRSPRRLGPAAESRQRRRERARQPASRYRHARRAPACICSERVQTAMNSARGTRRFSPGMRSKPRWVNLMATESHDAPTHLSDPPAGVMWHAVGACLNAPPAWKMRAVGSVHVRKGLSSVVSVACRIVRRGRGRVLGRRLRRWSGRVVELRREHPRWGAKRIPDQTETAEPGTPVPRTRSC